MTKTNIQWSEEVWNPVVGCTKVSSGCVNCYAATMAHRLEAMGQPQYKGLTEKHGNGILDWTGEVRMLPGRLDIPLRKKKPTMYFVNSMSDLFHESVDEQFIDAVFMRMSIAHQHIFQVLTKRPERMLEFCKKWRPVPLPNVWLGISAENQETADERIPLLLQTPAAVRWVSYEPAVAEVSFQRWMGRDALSWVVIGGESGSQARPLNVGWARQLIGDGRMTNTAVFVKQLGANPIGFFAREWPVHLKHHKGGDPNEWPADLRVRQWPATATEAQASS